MSDSATLTLSISQEVEERLGMLADRVKRPPAALAAAAVEDFVERELASIDGILEGIEDMRAGQIVPHEEAMRRIRQTIVEARKSK